MPVPLQVLLPDERSGKVRLQAAGVGANFRPVVDLFEELNTVHSACLATSPV